MLWELHSPRWPLGWPLLWTYELFCSVWRWEMVQALLIKYYRPLNGWRLASVGMLGLNLPPGQMCARTPVTVCKMCVWGYERKNREGGRGSCLTRVCAVKGLHVRGGQRRMFCGFLGWICCSGAGVWAGWWDPSSELSVSCKSVQVKELKFKEEHKGSNRRQACASIIDVCGIKDK